MPKGQKVSPHHWCCRKHTHTHILVWTSTIFGADVHGPKGSQILFSRKVCVDFLVNLVPKLRSKNGLAKGNVVIKIRREGGLVVKRPRVLSKNEISSK